MIWFRLYSNHEGPFSVELLQGLLALARRHFKLVSPTGNVGDNKERAIGDLDAWIQQAVAKQASDFYSNPHIPCMINLGGPSGPSHTTWVLYSLQRLERDIEVDPDEDPYERADEPRIPWDSSLLFGIQTKLELRQGAARLFVDELVPTVLANNEWWYGFIDVRPDDEVRIPPFYLSRLYNPNDWSRLVEQARWRLFSLARREVVRGIYWGNFFGPRMRDALERVGAPEFINHSVKYNFAEWPKVTSGPNGLFVRLGEDPVWFEKNRNKITSPDPSGAGHAAAILGEALSRASLL